MIILRRNTERRHVQHGKQDTWLTFYPNGRAGPLTDDFGALVAFNEMRLPPGAVSAQDTGTGTEIVTYVYRGALAQEDSTGNSGVVHSGEFQLMIVGHRVPPQGEKSITNRLRAHFPDRPAPFGGRPRLFS